MIHPSPQTPQNTHTTFTVTHFSVHLWQATIDPTLPQHTQAPFILLYKPLHTVLSLQAEVPSLRLVDSLSPLPPHPPQLLVLSPIVASGLTSKCQRIEKVGVVAQACNPSAPKKG